MMFSITLSQQHLRQLGNIGRNPPRLVLREQTRPLSFWRALFRKGLAISPSEIKRRRAVEAQFQFAPIHVTGKIEL